jgi:NhaA family Na+:H+ antiporter
MDQNSPDARPRSFLFGGGSSSELLRIGSILRKETVGGAMLVAAAIIALIWANSTLSAGYFQLRDIRVGYGPWHLELSLGEWASDGLLSIFFFLVGLELKREFLIGDLREPSKSVVPVAAAAGGVAVPAIIYSVVNLASPETLRGWAIPTATDIAFAVAVLALIGSHLPGALRIFLLTLAVVDDLIAIGIIAFFYSQDIRPEPLLLVLLALGSYAFLAHRYRRFFGTRAAAWLILLPLGAAAWVLVHNSGIHATVAGVMLGFAVPLAHSKADRSRGAGGRSHSS